MYRWIVIATLATACTPAHAAPSSTDEPRTLAPAPALVPAPAPAPDAVTVLDTHCRACHPNLGGSPDIFDVDRLRRDRLIGDRADTSPLYEEMLTGQMPPEDVEVRPTPAEIEAVRAWIDLLLATETAEQADRDGDVEEP